MTHRTVSRQAVEPGFVHSSPAVLPSRTLLVICLDSGLLLVRNRRLRLFHVSFSVDNDYSVKAGQCIDSVKHKAAVIRRFVELPRLCLVQNF